MTVSDGRDGDPYSCVNVIIEEGELAIRTH